MSPTQTAADLDAATRACTRSETFDALVAKRRVPTLRPIYGDNYSRAASVVRLALSQRGIAMFPAWGTFTGEGK